MLATDYNETKISKFNYGQNGSTLSINITGVVIKEDYELRDLPNISEYACRSRLIVPESEDLNIVFATPTNNLKRVDLIVSSRAGKLNLLSAPESKIKPVPHSHDICHWSIRTWRNFSHPRCSWYSSN
jgi:hypothetical protein